jgi:hypothetical protein
MPVIKGFTSVRSCAGRIIPADLTETVVEIKGSEEMTIQMNKSMSQ